MKGADSNLIAVLLWKQTSFRDDKCLACRYSTLNEIWGNRAVTSCEECVDSLEAHKKGKQESDWGCFTVPYKLPLKYTAAAPSCEQSEKPCCKACSQQRSWTRICTIFLYSLESGPAENRSKPVTSVLVGLSWAPSKLAPWAGVLANGPGDEWATKQLRLAPGHSRTGPWLAAMEALQEKLLPKIYSSCAADKMSISSTISLSPTTSVLCTYSAVVFSLLGVFFTCWTEGECKSAWLHQTLKLPAVPRP